MREKDRYLSSSPTGLGLLERLNDLSLGELERDLGEKQRNNIKKKITSIILIMTIKYIL